MTHYYWAGEDIPIGVILPHDTDPEGAAALASERFNQAMDIMEKALREHPDLNVSIGGRYDDDLSVYDSDTGKCVWGCR